jgi:mycothiol synthase
VTIVVRQPGGVGDLAAAAELLRVFSEAEGHEPLGDHRWLQSGQIDPDGITSFLAWEDRCFFPVGYAQVQATTGPYSVEVVAAAACGDDRVEVATALLSAALEEVRRNGGGPVQWWVPKAGPVDDEVAKAAGLADCRDLYQMRRALPVAEKELWVATRRFVPGRDELAFLEVNNRAFSWHPEQGGWDLATMLSREAEPWFDPAGFLLHEREGRLAAFCWTKVHDVDPPLGEIYVIAVDPSFQGLGLGRQLVLAGLAHLAGAGLRTAMLYVDATNRPALRLYEELGFSIHHVDRAYSGEVGAGG